MVAMCVAVAVGLGAGNALAAPGDFDPAFSGDGKATINFGGDEARDYADVATTPDGGSVLVGTTEAVPHPADHSLGFAIAKLGPGGTLDPSFSGDGKVVVELGISARANAVAVQPDGKIIVAGYDVAEGGATFFDVIRLNSDGTPDTSFGSGGTASAGFSGADQAAASDVAIAPDGKIVAAGLITPDGNPASYNFAVVRFNANGSRDTTFNGTGRLVGSLGGPDVATAVAVQPDGKIVTAGIDDDSMNAVRINTDGTLDTTFGFGGEAETSFPEKSQANALALQPDGAIILAGTEGDPNGNLAVARIEPSGSLDPSFSDDGIATLDLGSTDDTARSVALQANGKIVIGGEGGSDVRSLAAWRLNTNGSPDTTFGTGGAVAASFASTTQSGGSVAIQPDGQILLAGTTYNNDDFAIARLDGDPTSDGLPPGDTTPPQTRITREPANKSDGAKAKYRFTSSEAGSTFECAFDSNNFKPCDSGNAKYKHLDFGKHKFRVRATDAAGNTDTSPAKDKFKRKRR
jgi:uncharacterized delta-60 repeat protein